MSNEAAVDAGVSIMSAIAVLEAELTRTQAGTERYRSLLIAIRDLCDVLRDLVYV